MCSYADFSQLFRVYKYSKNINKNPPFTKFLIAPPPVSCDYMLIHCEIVDE